MKGLLQAKSRFYISHLETIIAGFVLFISISSACTQNSYAQEVIEPQALKEHKLRQLQHEIWTREHVIWKQEHKRAMAALRNFDKVLQDHSEALNRNQREIDQHERLIGEHGKILSADQSQGSIFSKHYNKLRKAHHRFEESHEKSLKRHADIMEVVEKVERLMASISKEAEL